MMEQFESQIKFWKSVALNKRTSKPLHFEKESFPKLPLSENEIFKATVIMCARYIENPFDCPIRFYINGKIVYHEIGFLPVKNDRTFSKWNQRVKKKLSEYALVINGLQEYFDVEAVSKINSYLMDISNGIGTPAWNSDLTLFAGSYKNTPFGVHTDREVNFYWPITGSKIMRFWDPSYGKKWQNLPALERKLSHRDLVKSKLVRAKVGDMLAWPGNWWHVGEAKTFNVSFTTPFYFPDFKRWNFKEERDKVMSGLIKASALISNVTLMPHQTLSDRSILPPRYISQAYTLLPKLYPASELKILLLEKWIRSVSTSWLDYKLPLIDEKKIEIKTDSVVTVPKVLLWVWVTSKLVCVASNGNSVTFQANTYSVRVIKHLSLAKHHRLEDLFQIFRQNKSKGTKAQLARLLVRLVSIGAIRISSNTDVAVKKIKG